MSEPIVGGLFHATYLNIIGDPSKASYIVQRLVEHETEWSDFQRSRPEVALSRLAEHYLPDGRTRIFEVWRMDEKPDLVGLVGWTDILPNVNASFHPVFFDGKFRNLMGKTDLLLRSMDWAFRAYDLHRISLEMPEDKVTLIDYARKKLGFRFEGERRSIRQRSSVRHGHLFKKTTREVWPAPYEAELGSRRYQSFFKNGKWLDVMLLSVTQAEFADFIRRGPRCLSSSADPIPNKPSPKTSKDFGDQSSKPSSAEDQAAASRE